MNLNVAAGVILYYPDEEVIKNIQSYQNQVAKVFVYDNTPEKPSVISKRISQLPSIQYIYSGANIGIASALNVLSIKTIEEGFEYIMTFDQDSFATDHIVSSLLQIAEFDQTIAIVSPLHKVQNEKIPPPTSQYDQILTTMTSGNLLRLSAYKTLGGFLDKLFIDYVDIEYCLRIHQQGMTIVRLNTVELFHRVGDLQQRRLLWTIVHPSNHSAARLYFKTRNRFYIKKLYTKQFIQYFRNDLQSFCFELIKILLFENKKYEKVKMIIKGYVAYCKNDFSYNPITMRDI